MSWRRPRWHRLIAILSSLGVLALSLWVLVEFDAGTGFQFVDQQTWVRAWDIKFYVGVDGLFVFEPVNEAEASDDSAQLILVAAWTDENKNALTQVPPQRTDKVVDLAAAGDDGSAGGSGGNGAA